MLYYSTKRYFAIGNKSLSILKDCVFGNDLCCRNTFYDMVCTTDDNVLTSQCFFMKHFLLCNLQSVTQFLIKLLYLLI